ncbi:hypothetical protein [uncultured Zhongshania sp.]|uniref:hypothetical protein n=1 Tax=uncultured Zhongshania sp. TaxID=1642288 RepID=UPI0030DB9D5A|tara:strand:- start:821 stop:1426 length:606 start_codon:yes stop_codon:yes gene_type:complete
MTEAQFDLLMTGDTAPGVDRNIAVSKLATLFKRPVEQVDKLLCGKPSRVRKNLNQAELERYQNAFESIGVITKAVASAQAADVPQIDKTPATLNLCPNGTPVLSEDERYRPAVAAPDTDHLSVADSGENLSSNDSIPVPAPDTDHISVAPVGSTILPPAPKENPPQKSLSHLSLCGPGTPLLDKKPEPNYRVPNTEHLSLQ